MNQPAKIRPMAVMLAAFMALAFSLQACSTLTKGFHGPYCACKNPSILRPQGVTLREVNGISVGPFSTGVEVLPGKNEVVLTLNPGNFTQAGASAVRYRLTMTAQGNREYAITTEPGRGHICAYEVDPHTGKPLYTISAGCAAME
jgi:hypothetical protein